MVIKCSMHVDTMNYPSGWSIKALQNVGKEAE